MNVYQMAWRNIRRNTRRSLLTASAIGVASATMTLMFSLVTGLANEIGYNLQTYYTGEVRVRHGDFDKFINLNPLNLSVVNASELVSEIAAMPGVASASGRIVFPASVYIAGENISALGQGMDMQNDIMQLAPFIIAGQLPQSGERQAVLGSALAKKLGLTVGDKFTLLSSTLRRATNGMTFTVYGIARLPLGELNDKFYAPLDTVQRFLKMGDRAIDLVIKTGPDNDVDALQLRIEQLLVRSNRPAFVVEQWDAIPSSYVFIQMAKMIYGVGAIIFYLLASTVIINTTMMTIFERTREIGTLAALGMEGKSIVRLFFLEATMLGTLGAVVGTLFGAIIALILEQTGLDFTSALGDMSIEISGVMYPQLTWGSAAIACFGAIIVASLISLWPAQRAAKIKPIEAMQSL